MWSEFGRRPEENGSLGTDHGAAGCAFVIGSQAKGEMVGEFPGLANTRRARQPAGDQRLPGDVLLAARAVARPRRRSDHPRRLGLRPAGAGEAVSASLPVSSFSAPLALALVVAPQLRLPVRTARHRKCRRGRLHLERHVKRVVKKGEAPRQGSAGRTPQATGGPACRGGRARSSRPPAPAPPAPSEPEPEPEANRARGQSGRVLLRALASERQCRRGDVELNNQGEDPHNLNLRLEGDGGEPMQIPETDSLDSERRRLRPADRQIPPLVLPPRTRGTRDGRPRCRSARSPSRI